VRTELPTSVAFVVGGGGGGVDGSVEVPPPAAGADGAGDVGAGEVEVEVEVGGLGAGGCGAGDGGAGVVGCGVDGLGAGVGFGAGDFGEGFGTAGLVIAGDGCACFELFADGDGGFDCCDPWAAGCGVGPAAGTSRTLEARWPGFRRAGEVAVGRVGEVGVTCTVDGPAA
jgi:hypothetical protein